MTTEYRIHLFARYAELLGSSVVRVDLREPATTRQLVAALRRQPGGEQLPESPFLAINGRHAPTDTSVTPDDEIALLPPLAGG